MDEEKIIEERKKKLKEFLFKKNFIFIIVLLVLLGIAWHIRTANVPGLKDATTGDYTLGPDLDPFLFLRYTKSIINTGSIPQMDYMRNVPWGYDTSTETQLLPYMMAYFYKIMIVFVPSATINYSAVIFPAFMFLLTVIAFFLLAGKIFEEHKYRWHIASLASLLLTITPSFLSRTIAGIPEKESAGFFFMFLAFYFFLDSFKSQNLKKSCLMAGLAGVSTVLMALIWGGVIYIFTAIGIFGLFLWILGKVDKKEIIAYAVWILISFIFLPMLSGRYSLMGLLASPSSGLGAVAFVLMGIDYLLFKTKIKEHNLVKSLEKKYPKKAISLVVFIAFSIIASTLVLGINFIPNFIGDIMFHLTQPYTDRFSFTVAENRQPYFSEWANEFGPTMQGIPIMFTLFFAGSVLLFYKTLKLDKKEKVYSTVVYLYFLVSLIFSRYSSSSLMNGTGFISQAFYFSGIVVFGGYLFYLSYIHEKKEGSMLKDSHLSYLFLFALFFVAIIGARSAIRLVMVLVPPASILVAFIPFEIFIKFKEKKEQKNFWLALLVIISILTLFVAFKFYQTTYASAQSYVPSAYTLQWQKAMAWVRNSTPENAVFSHWWDYGYWIQSIGERPTVLDGANAQVYWNHLFGYHVLTGHSEQEALEFLYTHNVSYLLIDPTDIGKYPAYSSIGSDENYNKYSWLTTFVMNEKLTKELRNETEFYYEGSYVLDEDFVYKKNDSETLFPGRKAAIQMIRVAMNGEKFKGADAYLVNYQGKRETVPLKCIFYDNKKYEFNVEGYNGCLDIVPMVSSSGTSINKKGAGIFVSSRVIKTLFAKLYLFNEGKNFELVHEEEDYIVQMINSQGLNITDFMVYGDIKGPIKIWKVNYPSNIKANPDYLKTSYPNDSVRLAKPGYY